MTESNYPTVESQIPARLDRLPFCRWHVLVILGLGITWVLDGLEITLVAALAATLTNPASGLSLSAAQVGLAASIYLLGAVSGSLFFAYLTDRFGRRKLFIITIVVYIVATVATGFAWTFWFFVLMRFFTGAAIGGEYSAIYSAVDELIPARIRGQIALLISGSYWLGAIFGALLSFWLLGAPWLSTFWAWRVAFFFGAVLGLSVLILRAWIPESPRWLATHGRNDEAERITSAVEEDVKQDTHRDELPPVDDEDTITIEERGAISFGLILHAMFRMYTKRTVLGLVLLTTQAFLYNAIFFTYALILVNYYGISDSQVPIYLIPFAVGNLLGAWLLGPLFDRVGRIPMITACYGLSGVLLAITGYLFSIGVLTAFTQTIAWMIVFFFATAAASAAYLTVSEVFPMEIRAMAIALFYTIGTGAGGVIAPYIFGLIIGSGEGSRQLLFYAYLIAAALMIGAAITEMFLGVKAERSSLESVAAPLTAIEKDSGSSAAGTFASR